MKKSAGLVLSTIFSASTLLLSPDMAQAQSYKSNANIKTDLGGLYDEKGAAFDEGALEGKYALIFFGTEYQTPSCASLFGEQGLVLRNLAARCGTDEGNIVPIFICPYVQEKSKNQTSKSKAKSNDFTILQADLETVKALAAKYYASYFMPDAYGDPAKHTAFIYLQDDQGENILYYNAKTEFGARALPQVEKALTRAGYECN